MFNSRLFGVILVALSTTACGEFDAAGFLNHSTRESISPAKPFGTCDRQAVATINLCVEAIGSDYNDPGYLDILQSSCESTGGVYSTNICDRTGSLGTCVVDGGLSNETHVTYYPPQYTALSAQAACAATPGGVYTSN